MWFFGGKLESHEKEVQTESVVFEEYVDQLMSRQDEYAKELRKALIGRLSDEKRALKKRESHQIVVVNEAAVNIQKAWRKKRKRRPVLPMFTARDRRIVNIMKKIPMSRVGEICGTRVWMSRFVAEIYREKLKSDETDDRDKHPRASMPFYILEYLKEKYGTRKLVHQYVGRMVVTASSFASSDKRMEMFLDFVTERRPMRELNLFLKGMHLLDTMAVGPSMYGEEDDGIEPAFVCLRRALVVAPEILADLDAFALRGAIKELQNRSFPLKESEIRPEGLPRTAQDRKIQRIDVLSVCLDAFEQWERDGGFSLGAEETVDNGEEYQNAELSDEGSDEDPSIQPKIQRDEKKDEKETEIKVDDEF
eukprot:TRINITY_DN9751_c0_g1_i1.p1 TRINITY_DN9751_c0_g1~~TRINITY_DN9751_c0_g1_i1.p1  ORF type:complete len:364 (+),score=116.89 TRINITY_DN9751_c0_g1_i1:943-2034(+)